ncbi:SacI homology domain-domain-containing protein [Catenaria anguillulae PL171]|uniref:SacI homology domain-domain-containing protein n=1 Tax=Catenaria anguillulae PL171 TaxID=765915 RepID=A0A1Y2HT28_9FUNG|nr:SacI homology domain-domain-containing protein [Catenaria anguillulae PL171]
MSRLRLAPSILLRVRLPTYQLRFNFPLKPFPFAFSFRTFSISTSSYYAMHYRDPLHLPPDPEPRSIHVLTSGRIVIESLSTSPSLSPPDSEQTSIQQNSFPHVSFSPQTFHSASAPTWGSDSDAGPASLVFDGTSPKPFIEHPPVDDYGPIRTAPNHNSIARHLSHVGLLGILDLGFASHLLFATRATCVAQLAGAPIYKISSVDSLPIVSPPTRSMAQEAYEATALRNLLYYLNHHPLFYSRHVDLSRSIRVQSLGPHASQPNWDFIVNSTLLPRSLMYPTSASTTLDSPLHLTATRFFVPVIAGHVSQATPLPSLKLTLIARSNTLRLGRRYFSRGMAPEGGSGCSNAIESELVVSHGPRLAAHLQWRGSVPLVWSQVPTYDLTVWKPPVVVSALHARGDWNPVLRYLRAWTKLVPRVVFLDLLDRTNRGERVLSETFEQAVGELRDAAEPVANTTGDRQGEHSEASGTCWPVEYVHAAVAGRTHAAVRRVVDEVSASPGVHQVTSVDLAAGGSRAARGSVQSTVIRTNCLDSIDRTNLVQLEIATLALDPLLDAIDYTERDPAAKSAIRSALRCMWTTHGHDLARHYVGTRAVSQELACQPTGLSTRVRRPWIGIGIENEATLARRQYLQYFVDPCLQDVFDEHLCPAATATAAGPRSGTTGPTANTVVHIAPAHVRQRLFALQRKVSGDECELPLVGFAFVFIRKHLAPMNVDGVLGLLASVVWMAAAVVVQWWLGGGAVEAARGIVRRPRRLAMMTGFGSRVNVGNAMVSGNTVGGGEGNRRT